MIVARVRRTLRERGLVARGMRVLAACSGGPDSAAMLVALARLRADLGFELEAASIDHGLREGSAADVELARAQSDALGVPFHARRVQVARASSIQAAARAARYAALAELAAGLGAERIAVGHTQEDQAETLLLRLLRGAGVRGLGGIEPLREDGVIRPLIDCRRADVVAFASCHVAALAHDPSNEDRAFERVRVRMDVLPLLEREDSSIVAHLAELADDARALLAALAPQVDALLGAALQEDESIQLSVLDRAPPGLRRLALRAWLARVTGREPGRSHLEQLEHAADQAVEVWLPKGWVVRSSAGLLQVSRSVNRGSE